MSCELSETSSTEAGLARLAQLLPGTARLEFEILAAQLREAEQELATFGSDPTTERAKGTIVAQLDALTHQVWGLATPHTFTRLAQCRADSTSPVEALIRIDFEAGLARLSDLLPASARSEFEALAAQLREAIWGLRIYGFDTRVREIKWDAVRSLNALTYRVFGSDTVNAFTTLCQEKEDDATLLLRGIVNAYIKGQE